MGGYRLSMAYNTKILKEFMKGNNKQKKKMIKTLGEQIDNLTELYNSMNTIYYTKK